MIFMHTVFIDDLFLCEKYLFGKTNVEIVKFYKKNKKSQLINVFLQFSRKKTDSILKFWENFWEIW